MFLGIAFSLPSGAASARLKSYGIMSLCRICARASSKQTLEAIGDANVLRGERHPHGPKERFPLDAEFVRGFGERSE